QNRRVFIVLLWNVVHLCRDKLVHHALFLSSVVEIHIRVVEGRAVTLPCRAPNMEDPIKYLEWSRTDQKMSYIILYQDQHFYPDFQDRAFRERAVLLDRDMKEGEVSLVLRNASAGDSGVYECRVVQAVGRRQKRSVLMAEPNMIIKLRVGPESESGPKPSGLTLPVLFSLLTLVIDALLGYLLYKPLK
uniref:Ig-like domain-containing protein n=1 Tax=Poecilia formosa TaxID=48698 RepID=A0A087X6F9_POEFO